MIKIHQLVPSVYYNRSRDFQLLGRIFDVVFNYTYNNSKLVSNNPYSPNMDKRLLDLLSLTLGFKSQHDYNSKQLFAMCSTFMNIIKNKGSLKSIQDALDVMTQAEGLKERIIVEPSLDKLSIVVYIPSEMKDINLFNDLLDYILPAGMSCIIIQKGALVSNDHSTFTTEKNIITTISKPEDVTSIIPKSGIDAIVRPSDIVRGRMDNSTIFRQKYKGTKVKWGRVDKDMHTEGD